MILAEARHEPLSKIAEQLEPLAYAASYIYIFQVINKGQNSVVRKDLAEIVEFLREIDQTFNGFIDTQLCELVDPNDAEM